MQGGDPGEHREQPLDDDFARLGVRLDPAADRVGHVVTVRATVAAEDEGAVRGCMAESTTARVPALTTRTAPASSPITSATYARPSRSASADRQMLPVQTIRTVKAGA